MVYTNTMEHEPATDVSQLTEAMDHETLVWSGGFENSAHYQAIVDAGTAALPQLIAELDAGAFWVSRCELVAEIAQSAGLELTENGLSFDLRQGAQDAEDARDARSAGGEIRADIAPEAAPPTARPLGYERWRGVRIDMMV